MDKPSPPFNMLMHPKYRDTPFDDLPPQLQKRLLKYQARQGQTDDVGATTPVSAVEVPEPVEAVEEDPKVEEVEETEEVEESFEESSEEEDDEVEDEVDEDEDEDEDEESESEFPAHVGGGYYELSNGERVRGIDDAIAAQAELD